MQKFTNEEKAQIYNTLLYQYQKIQEEIRLIKSENFEVSFQDQKKINFLELKAKKLFEDTKRLYS